MFIAGLKMGVAGAAIATDISQLVSCVLRLLLQKIFRNCRCHFLTALRHVFFHNAGPC